MAVESNPQQNGASGNGATEQRKESLYDEYQRKLIPSSEDKSSKGKSSNFLKRAAASDPVPSNEIHQRNEPADSNAVATRDQNGSGEGSSSRRKKSPKDQETYEYPPQVRGFKRDEMSLEIMLVDDGNDDDSFKSIGVVGAPAVGKTTLVWKLILENERVKGSYGRMIWVSLSKLKQPEIEGGEAVEYLSGEDEFSNLLRTGLNEQLEENKCLIVLDDVGEGEGGTFYEDLKACFSHDSGQPPRKKGGTIIVTSRSEEEAEKVMKLVGKELLFHRLMPLSDLRSCWLIYKDAVEVVKPEEDTNASKDVMEELMKKCGGLPGVARMLGKIKAEKLKKN